ncbi:MAG TPA: RNA methyltransferase [Thermodesulfovibrionales bacterium]|nr:RNA methyltransferase [Thermodesulfovibrionales bacterium]
MTAKIIMKLLNYAMKTWQDNLSFVLVEPKEPGNIGASARAIKNMGFRNLCLVNPRTELTDEARWLACNSLDVLRAAETYPDVKSAVRDKSVVIGTSRRTGKRRGVILPIQQGAERIIAFAKRATVAILFGREDRGLLNDEVNECGMLLTIPTSKEHRSLNLAQAVLIVAYELLKAGYAEKAKSGELKTKHKIRKPVPRNMESGEFGTVMVGHGEISALYDRMTDTLKLLEYIPRGDRNLEAKIMQNLRHFIARAGLTEWELNMLHGILTRIEQKVKR